MKAFAEHEFRMMETDEKNVSYRESLQELINRDSTKPARREELLAELRGPPIPASAAYLWQWWWRLHRRRPSGGMGIASITWSEIKAWSELTGTEVLPWEIEIIEAVEDEFMKSVNRRLKAETPQEM